MLCLCVNVLGGVYWQKTGKKKIPKFIDEIIDLYDAVNSGAVKWEEVINVAKEYGLEFDKDKVINGGKK